MARLHAESRRASRGRGSALWLRVRGHQREGDFQRYGYFAGIELDTKPPLIWLAAPALLPFGDGHPAEYLSPEIQVTRIGLNEKWRRGLEGVFRQ